MRKFILATALALSSASFTTFAKDNKAANDTTIVMTVSPVMHCQNCENKIKQNLRFEKGVKAIDTNLEKQTISIKGDKRHLNASKLIAAFRKIGYTATEVK